MPRARRYLFTVFTYLLFYGGLVYATAPALLRKLHGNDLWKALYSGRYLALFHQFPHHSTFTYSPVKDVLTRNAFNWLGNLFYVGWYSLGGDLGLQLLRVLVPLFVVLLYHSLVRYERSPLLLMVFVVFVFGLTQKLILRTAIFSLPFTALLFWFWHRAEEEERIQWLYAVPVLLVVWSNVHGSYIVGWGLFGVLTTGRFLREYVPAFTPPKRRLFKRCLILLLVTIPLVTAVKPFPETTLADQFSGVAERLVAPAEAPDPNPNPEATDARSPRTFLQQLKAYLGGSLFPEKTFRSAEFELVLENTRFAFVKANILLFFLFLGTLLFSRRTNATEWLLFLVGSFFGLSYLRTSAYLPLIALPVVLPRLRSDRGGSPRWRPWVTLPSAFLVLAWIGAVSAFLVTGSARTLTGNYFHEFGFGRIDRFRGSVPAKVLSEYPDEKVGNTYNTGSFLIWSWWPHKKVLVDSKGSAYTDAFWERIVNEDARSNLVEDGIHLFVTETTNRQVIRSLDDAEGWSRRFRDAGLLLYEYQGEPSPANGSNRGEETSFSPISSVGPASFGRSTLLPDRRGTDVGQKRPLLLSAHGN